MIDFKVLSDYAATFTHSENDLLRQMEEKAAEIYIPIMQPSAMAFLQQLIRWRSARKILELGTAIGYSSIRMALAAGNDTTIVSVERDEAMIEEATQNIEALNLQERIQIVAGDATDDLSEVASAAPYDLILIDAAKVQYEHLFEKCSGLLADQGIIVTDNVFFHGLVCDIDAVQKKQLHRLVKKVDAFNHFLSEREDFDTIFLTVGDGMAVSTKRSCAEGER
ncbi:O-methyltransferase [Sporolactobacillus shoreicorticis]|uniref:tRNA 5-hydroxyuridine methyltransferase n=1 Tax=Sporolactobacillus shoreicorticis TaxID=1923877 RepID=A0ABW5S4H1_9BACL|nr:O-methyltransferase [Sporolactobacillus shoreicorticis]MCO7126378.1 O-methyltransferase [Sporolactobacillus shoreicorticis]